MSRGWVVQIPRLRGGWCYLVQPAGRHRATDSAYAWDAWDDAVASLEAERTAANYRAPELDSSGYADRIHRAEVADLATVQANRAAEGLDPLEVLRG